MTRYLFRAALFFFFAERLLTAPPTPRPSR